MKNRVVARAPGKLFVLGEYAVLDGCPAVVAAVDRFLEVALDGNGRDGLTRIRSGTAHVEFPTGAPPDETGPWRFVLEAFRSSLRQNPELADRSFAIDIVSRLDTHRGTKAGLGSSAAVTVGLMAAMSAATGQRLSGVDDRDRLFAAALDAHRRVQGALGSGADVAASTYGGLILFQPHDGSAEINPLTLPADTHFLAASTGEPASTTDLVSQYRQKQNGKAAIRTAFVEASRHSVKEFVAMLAQGSLSLAAVLRNGALLEQLATDLSLPLLTPRLRRIVEIARAHGAAAKISGAGGGDCGIALTRDASEAREIRDAWQAAGLVPLDLHICTEGVTVVDG
jgi:phosphomevalonate kinase